MDDYVDAVEKVGILEITIGMMELMPGMKEDSQKATKSIRKTKVFIEKGDWISAVCSLEKVQDLVRNYRESLPIIKLRDDYTLNSLEKNIAAVEGFLARQIREEGGDSSCLESQSISRRPKKTSSIRLRKSLKLES